MKNDIPKQDIEIKETEGKTKAHKIKWRRPLHSII